MTTRRYSFLFLSLILLFSSLVAGCDSDDEPVRAAIAFPDPIMEIAIREAIGKPEGLIYASDLASLTKFRAENKGIVNLSGMEHCINLTELSTYNNQIIDLTPLSNLTNLTYLHLANNEVSDISPLSLLSSLVNLNLAGNKIEDISSLSSLTNLTTLRLGGAQLNDISPLSSLTNLTELWLVESQVSDISPLSSLTSLRRLYLWEIKLSSNSINTILPQLKSRGLGISYRPSLDTPGLTPIPTTTPTRPTNELKVHFIDVGQGDAILIDVGETEILIDGGGKSPGIVSYLYDYVDGVLEVVVATHPHADHIGGLISVLDAFEVDEIWLNGDTSTSQTYSMFMATVNSEGAPVYKARRGDTIEVGEVAFDVLHPVNLSGTVNNNSIVLSLSHGEVDFLFTGDAEQEAEASMLTADIVTDVEILKVGHHGSRTASSRQFLQVAKPEYAIYMAGEGNSYGHPHQETTTSLNEMRALIYGTDEYGTIIITTDGNIFSGPIHHSAIPESITPPEEKQVIKDLAYILISAGSYTDDADPEPEGISLRINFYDSKSERITFKNIPVTVTIELYGYRDSLWLLKGEKGELVYHEQITIDYSNENIRRPFEEIAVDQNKYDDYGTMGVTVTIPEQGSFQDRSSPVCLYSEEVAQEEDLLLEIVSVSSPIGKGYTATLQAKTVPGAQCTITVYYKSGASSASGLYSKEADSQGNVSWSWKVGTRTTPGSWRIMVTASLDGETVSQTTYFTVY